ncbi:MAG: hypothetical protein ACK8QZ_04155, partial [Anaerolineales bacterium]
MPERHREKLARATGGLVAQIEPSNPKEALAVLLRSFDDKTKTTIKTHRKRFIMFESEQPKANHTWGAYWHEYWEVARAALEHLAQDKRGKEKENYIKRELRRFKRIGEGEEIPFLAGSDTDLLEEYAKEVAKRVSENSEIERLWRTLWRMPFTPCDEEQSIKWLSQSTEQGGETANGSTVSTPIAFRPLTAEEVAGRDVDGWLLEGHLDRSRYFSFGVPIPSRWFIPRISLGWVSYRDKFRLFVLPEQFRGYERDLQGPDAEMYWDAVPDFLPWLESVGGSEGCLPLPEYSDELGYGWYESEFCAVSEVTLAIEPDETGTPTLKIYKDFSTEAVPVAFVEGCDDNEAREIDLVERILRSSNGVGFNDFIQGFPFWPQRADARECEEALAKLGLANVKLAYKNGLLDIYGDNGSDDDIPTWAVDVAAPLVGGQDSARDDLLFAGGSEYRFYPKFSFDEEHTDAAPAGSLAAAIIANA